MAPHQKLEGTEFKLIEHPEHDVGTRFSHFGYCGSSPGFLEAGAELTGIEDAIAVIVLEDPVDQVSEPITTECNVRFLPMRGDKLDVNVVCDVSGGKAEYSFFVDVAGGLFNSETHWVNLLRNCMKLGVLFSPSQDSSGYLVEIDDPDNEGRKTLVAASSQLPYYAWEGRGKIAVLRWSAGRNPPQLA